eukprot:sb/3473824/
MSLVYLPPPRRTRSRPTWPQGNLTPLLTSYDFTGKQPIRTRYLDHVAGYQPIRDQYYLLLLHTAGEMIKERWQDPSKHPKDLDNYWGKDQGEDVKPNTSYLQLFCQLFYEMTREFSELSSCLSAGSRFYSPLSLAVHFDNMRVKV